MHINDLPDSVWRVVFRSLRCYLVTQLFCFQRSCRAAHALVERLFCLQAYAQFAVRTLGKKERFITLPRDHVVFLDPQWYDAQQELRTLLDYYVPFIPIYRISVGTEVVGAQARAALMEVAQRSASTLQDYSASDVEDVDYLLDVLGAMTDLRSLHLTFRRVSAVTCKPCRLQLARLTRLSIYHWNDTYQLDMRGLTALRSLTVLGSSSLLENACGPVPSLRHLQVVENTIAPYRVDHLPALFPAVEELVLSASDMKRFLLGLLPQYPNLRHLDLTYCRLDGDLFRQLHVEEYKQLETLILTDNHRLLSEAHLLHDTLAQMPCLQKLALDSCGFGCEDHIVILQGLETVQQVSMCDQSLRVRHVLKLLKHVPPSIQTLWIHEETFYDMRELLDTVDPRLGPIFYPVFGILH